MTPERTGERAEGFTLGYDRFDAAEEGLRDALTSTGNGYFCTRGAAEWEDAGDVHYRAPTCTAATTVRRRSWAAGRSSTRIS